MQVQKEAWLFVREDESIKLTKLPLGVTLVVFGPRTAEHFHHFNSVASLDDFEQWYRRHLELDGWMPLEVDDRRGPSRRRPDAQERRRN